MMYELVSKKTNKLNIVDEDTYNDLKEKGNLKKYNVNIIPQAKKIIPEEIIMKKKVTKQNNND